MNIYFIFSNIYLYIHTNYIYIYLNNIKNIDVGRGGSN